MGRHSMCKSCLNSWKAEPGCVREVWVAPEPPAGAVLGQAASSLSPCHLSIQVTSPWAGWAYSASCRQRPHLWGWGSHVPVCVRLWLEAAGGGLGESLSCPPTGPSIRRLHLLSACKCPSVWARQWARGVRGVLLGRHVCGSARVVNQMA